MRDSLNKMVHILLNNYEYVKKHTWIEDINGLLNNQEHTYFLYVKCLVAGVIKDDGILVDVQVNDKCVMKCIDYTLKNYKLSFKNDVTIYDKILKSRDNSGIEWFIVNKVCEAIDTFDSYLVEMLLKGSSIKIKTSIPYDRCFNHPANIGSNWILSTLLEHTDFNYVIPSSLIIDEPGCKQVLLEHYGLYSEEYARKLSKSGLFDFSNFTDFVVKYMENVKDDYERFIKGLFRYVKDDIFANFKLTKIFSYEAHDDDELCDKVLKLVNCYLEIAEERNLNIRLDAGYFFDYFMRFDEFEYLQLIHRYLNLVDYSNEQTRKNIIANMPRNQHDRMRLEYLRTVNNFFDVKDYFDVFEYFKYSAVFHNHLEELIGYYHMGLYDCGDLLVSYLEQLNYSSVNALLSKDLKYEYKFVSRFILNTKGRFITANYFESTLKRYKGNKHLVAQELLYGEDKEEVAIGLDYFN